MILQLSHFAPSLDPSSKGFLRGHDRIIDCCKYVQICFSSIWNGDLLLGRRVDWSFAGSSCQQPLYSEDWWASLARVLSRQKFEKKKSLYCLEKSFRECKYHEFWKAPSMMGAIAASRQLGKFD